MRILFVSPGFPPMIGGGQRYAYELARELVRRGHDLTIATTNARQETDFWRWRLRPGKSETSREEGLTVIRCPAPGIPGNRAALLAWRKAMILLSALRGDRSRLLLRMSRLVPRIVGLERSLGTLGTFDMVHAFNLSWEHAIVAGHSWARRHHVPLVVTPFMHLGAGPGDRVALNNTMDHQVRILRSAQAVLALTTVEKEHLASLQVPPERIHVVGGGIRPTGPSPAAGEIAAVLRRLELPRPFVLFLGRVSRDKGAIVASEAIQRLTNSISSPCLVLAGQIAHEFGRYLRRLPQEARAKVRPLGPVSERTKQALLAAAEMLVLPSRVDSFGIVLLEAWAHGKPVIAARAGGLPGVVAHGQDGLLVAPDSAQDLAQAMGTLLDSPTMAARLGQSGRRKLRSYTWEATAERVEQAYAAARNTSSLDDGTYVPYTWPTGS